MCTEIYIHSTNQPSSYGEERGESATMMMMKHCCIECYEHIHTPTHHHRVLSCLFSLNQKGRQIEVPLFSTNYTYH